MSLKRRLIERIGAQGPLTIAEYMEACLHDPQAGYYATRPALGEAGDFITAPLVSQMFGELIGLWAAQVWRDLGEPDRVRLVELGPGDGTLMSDMLRAAKALPGFRQAAEVVLLETSQPLRDAQRQRLAPDCAPRWVSSVDEIPADTPLILIGNEFLDCLPTRQFRRLTGGWAERLVGADGDALTFTDGAVGSWPGAPEPRFAEGELCEISLAAAAVGRQIGQLIRQAEGAALMIDYGALQPEPGDTLQALKQHEKVDPLACPGEADLTVHADFSSFFRGARDGPGDVGLGCATQADFLIRLGINQRVALLAQANPERWPTLRRQLHRLIAPEEMGALFKAVCVFYPESIAPPGFDPPP